MEFSIRPFHKNSYPKRAVLIKGDNAAVWLHETYKMGLDPNDAVMYALPGAVANQLFGCLVVPKASFKADVRNNSFMQCINGRLFIPENTIIFPELAKTEWDKHFPGAAYVMHPDIGLAELEEEIDWGTLLQLPQEARAVITTPSKGVYIPQAIRSISIDADKDALAESIEKQAGEGAEAIPVNLEKVMQGNQREIDKLLKYLEKHPEAALSLGIPLDTLGSFRGGGGGSYKFGSSRETRSESRFELSTEGRILIYVLVGFIVFILLIALLNRTGGGGSGMMPFFLIILVGRFMFWLFRRGSNDDAPRRAPQQSSGRATTIDNDTFADLQKKYTQLAEDFVAQKEYQKAAAVYLKLLKNYWKAAQVLEEGGYYGEAGAIYLKYCKNKHHAAECFEKGRLYNQAIEIYKELEQTEKVAELYALLNQNEEAMRYYGMVAEDYISKNQYVKASLIYRKKMDQPLQAQALLLEGWHKKLDAHNCLNNYFANIENPDALIAEIKRFYKDELESSRGDAFLQIIKIEFHKHEALQAPVRDIAYEIIASRLDATPFIASELIAFNPKDKTLGKDVMKFKASRVKRG